MTDPRNRLTDAEIVEVLKMFSGAFDDLLGHPDSDGRLVISVDCSDFFDWASADCEEITPESLPCLRQAFADLKPFVDESADWHLSWLYAARIRGIRPMPQSYKAIDGAEVTALFDACGPERDLKTEGIWGSNRGQATPWISEGPA